MSGLTLIAVVAVFLLAPIPQDIAFHNFADHRPFLGISNFGDVASNLAFLVVGITGLVLLRKARLPAGMSAIYAVLFTGIILTGLGSAYYHTAPDNDRLVYDRIPMTIVFMSLFSATVAELIDQKAGVGLLVPLVLTGIISVLYWHYGELTGNGDLRLYFLVQYYPMLFIPLILWLFYRPGQNQGVRELVWVVVWYVIAKVLEHFDKEIYAAIKVISGHSLKHLAAAMATWWLVRMFRMKYIKSK
ncbi:MAG TPA: ceramidase domain-containing protein [Puia sp.]|nr:ceramidase domain-containing protein [Puia sp.]